MSDVDIPAEVSELAPTTEPSGPSFDATRAPSGGKSDGPSETTPFEEPEPPPPEPPTSIFPYQLAWTPAYRRSR